MRKFIILTILTGAMLLLVGTSCKKEFFNHPPEAAITVGNFYQTTDQVKASTNGLYSAVWFGYVGKSGLSICELAGGNGRTYSPDISAYGTFSAFSSISTDFENSASWNAFYNVIAQSNALINNLPVQVSSNVAPADVNNALGEAHFMRAVAYFHLVRIYGNVPIVTNSTDLISNYQVHTNPVADIYKFIIKDLLFAETNCNKMIRGSTYASNARVSSGSASAMLAKVYLYMRDYADARSEAEKVINSGEFKLYGVDIPGKTFSDLFLTANNNNEESIFQLQWAGGAAYGFGNPEQSILAYNSTITGTSDGYAQIGPTFNLQDLYSSSDQRRKSTIMLPGDHYPELDQSTGGFTFPGFPQAGSAQNTNAAVKKYVVGTPADNGGIGAMQSTGNNTYIMRYAEVFLIEAEAVMAGAKTSSDPMALNAINKIRTRAGLSPLTVIDRSGFVPNPNYVAGSNLDSQHWPTIYKDDLFDERRRELAFENDLWYDLGRLDGFNVPNHPLAIQIISQQDRGIAIDNSSSAEVNRYPSYEAPTSGQFLFPYPATEVSADPLLTQAPVPYKF